MGTKVWLWCMSIGFCGAGDLNRSNVVMWFKRLPKSNKLSLVHTGPLSGVPNLQKRAVQENKIRQGCLCTGTLSSGQPHYIYRILLYCDDFESRSQMYPHGSLGGAYFIPIGMSLRQRRSNKCVRTVSVTPNGVSSNFVIDFIIDDLEKAATEGLVATDANGSKCVVFVEVVGFVADYPASCVVLDVLSHTDHSPRTHCTFRVIEGPERDNISVYARASSIHSANTNFTRSIYRTHAVRSTNPDENDLNLLGMKPGKFGQGEVSAKWFLVRMSASFLSERYGKKCLDRPYRWTNGIATLETLSHPTTYSLGLLQVYLNAASLISFRKGWLIDSN